MQQLIHQISHLSRQDRIQLLRIIAESLATEEITESEEAGLEIALERAKAVDNGEDRLIPQADFWAKVEAYRKAQ